MKTRLELILMICKEVGLQRIHPDKQYLTRRELEHLLGWIKARGKK